MVQGWAGTGKSTVLDAMSQDVLDAGGLVIAVPPGFDFAVRRSTSDGDSLTATIRCVGGQTGLIAEHVLRHGIDRPVLLTIDDVNELGDEQCRHLRSLIRGVGTELTVAVSIRAQLGCSGEAGRLIDDLQQVMRAHVVNLGPWSAETVVAWSETELDSSIGLSSARTIVEWTAGLPGWTTFVTRALLDAGLLRPVAGHLELGADLHRAAESVGPAVRRYLDPASEQRWMVAELLLRTGPIPIGHLERLSQTTRRSDGDSLREAAGHLLDEAILSAGPGQTISFTNPIIEAVVQLEGSPNRAADQQLVETITADAGHRTDRYLARALCRVANSTPVGVDAGELLIAAEQIAPFDPILARKTVGVVLSQGGTAIAGARRLLAQLLAIDSDQRATVGRGDESLQVSGRNDGTLATHASAKPAVAGVMSGRPGRCVPNLDATVVSYYHNRPSASPLEGVQLDFDLASHLLSTGRPLDAGRLLDSLAVEPPAGTLAVRLRRLRNLHSVMTGGVCDEEATEEFARHRDPVLFCTSALLSLRRSRSARLEVPDPGPAASGRWRRMIDWLESTRTGTPDVLASSKGGIPATGSVSIEQFRSFVDQSFVDGAILVVGSLEGVPDPKTRETFQRLLLTSWAADLPPQRTGAADLLLDPYDERIARLVAEGLTNAEVAARLDVALYTISNRLKVIYRRLGVHNRTALRGAIYGAA